MLSRTKNRWLTNPGGGFSTDMEVLVIPVDSRGNVLSLEADIVPIKAARFRFEMHDQAQGFCVVDGAG